MTIDKQMELISGMDKKLMDVMISKGKDYGTVDTLSNFKRVSAAAKALGIDSTTPTGYALYMVLLKLDRINNLITGEKVPNNEGIEDSFGDGINYMKLAYCLYTEESGEGKFMP